MVESQIGAARKQKKSNLQCRASQFNNWVINQEGLEYTQSMLTDVASSATISTIAPDWSDCIVHNFIVSR